MSLLAKVKTSRTTKPVRMALYGRTGAGKTSFAADAPSPVFLAAEDGLVSVETPSFHPENFPEVLTFLDELIKGAHTYRTLVVDSLDWLELLLHKHVAEQNGVESLGDVPYGKLYDKLPGRWREVLVKLQTLQEKRQMNVILICHQQNRQIFNPDGADYSCADLKLHESKTVKTGELIREWVDIVAMADIEKAVTDKDSGAKVKTSKNFLLYTGTNLARVTKSRYPIPDKLPLDWRKFQAALDDARPRTVDEALAELKTLGATQEHIEKAGQDVNKLNRLVHWYKDKSK